MSDRVEGTVGDDAGQAAQGKRNQQQNMRAGDVHVSTSSEFPVWRLIEMASDIRSLVNERLPNRVERLERLEVVVRPGPPPEVVVRPIANDTVNLSVRMIVIVLAVSLAIAFGMVAWLIFTQVARV